MILCVFAKNTRSGSVLAIAGGKSGGALQNGLQILQTDLITGTGLSFALKHSDLAKKFTSDNDIIAVLSV